MRQMRHKHSQQHMQHLRRKRNDKLRLIEKLEALTYSPEPGEAENARLHLARERRQWEEN